MSKGWRIHLGQLYQDPRGFYLTPRRTFLANGDGDPLLYHPDTGKPTAPFHEWMAWQFLIWACVYEGGGRDIHREGLVVHLARGQCLYSLDYLKEAWGWRSRSRVSRFLTRLEVSGRVRLDWPSYRAVCNGNGAPGATVPAGSTGGVNTKRGLLTNNGTPHKRIVQRKTQRLGRLITVLKYDTYQDPAFYSATPLATLTPGVAGLSRDTDGTNKNAVKKYKNREPRTRVVHKGSTAPPPPPQDQDPTPVTWDAIRGALRLGVWANLPAHVQEAQLQEALNQEPKVPEDLKHIINGTPSPEADELTRLRQVRAMLKGDE